MNIYLLVLYPQWIPQFRVIIKQTSIENNEQKIKDNFKNKQWELIGVLVGQDLTWHFGDINNKIKNISVLEYIIYQNNLKKTEHGHHELTLSI